VKSEIHSRSKCLHLLIADATAADATAVTAYIRLLFNWQNKLNKIKLILEFIRKFLNPWILYRLDGTQN